MQAVLSALCPLGCRVPAGEPLPVAVVHSLEGRHWQEHGSCCQHQAPEVIAHACMGLVLGRRGAEEGVAAQPARHAALSGLEPHGICYHDMQHCYILSAMACVRLTLGCAYGGCILASWLEALLADSLSGASKRAMPGFLDRHTWQRVLTLPRTGRGWPCQAPGTARSRSLTAGACLSSSSECCRA